MQNIEVKVLDCHGEPTRIMAALARLTQRGHSISSMAELEELFSRVPSDGLSRAMANLPHGTIKRFCPITIAIVGASRRFLAQARTHQVGFNYVSASLQYSDYTGKAQFVVPYALLENKPSRDLYLKSCDDAMKVYEYIAADTDNDTAGYAAPQGLRNILIMQGNHEAWMNFISKRSCNRNTVETQYVTMRIWEELLGTPGGDAMFEYAGPDCMYGKCREGKFCCGVPMKAYANNPRGFIDDKWPLLKEI